MRRSKRSAFALYEVLLGLAIFVIGHAVCALSDTFTVSSIIIRIISGDYGFTNAFAIPLDSKDRSQLSRSFDVDNCWNNRHWWSYRLDSSSSSSWL